MRTTPSNDYVDITIRARYAETDRMSVVYYANYFVWFELGRTEFLRARGGDYKEMEEQEGAYLVVAEARCQYRRPIYYDDVIILRTRLKQVRSRSLTFSYEILPQDSGQLIATGETVHVVTDRTGRPRTLSARYHKILGRAATAEPAAATSPSEKQ